MKNLKPSQLPEGSVIDDEKHGEFIKREEGLWESIFQDYMGDRHEIRDVVPVDNIWPPKSDDYFQVYILVSTSPGFDFRGKALMIHGPWDDRIGGFTDGSRPHECKGYNCDA